jgi:hypothetical protein
VTGVSDDASVVGFALDWDPTRYGPFGENLMADYVGEQVYARLRGGRLEQGPAGPGGPPPL